VHRIILLIHGGCLHTDGLDVVFVALCVIDGQTLMHITAHTKANAFDGRFL